MVALIQQAIQIIGVLPIQSITKQIISVLMGNDKKVGESVLKSEQKLIATRNLLRYIMHEMSEEFDDHYREDHEFFNHVVNEGMKIKLIKKLSPVFGITRYALTDSEKINNPRHKGKAQYKQRLL